MSADTFVHCLCRRLLAVEKPDGSFEVRHRGRTVSFAGAGKVRCEECGRTVALDRLAVALVHS